MYGTGRKSLHLACCLPEVKSTPWTFLGRAAQPPWVRNEMVQLQFIGMRRRTPGLSIDDMQALGRHFRDEAKKARRLGDVVKAERNDREALKYEEKAAAAAEKLKLKPR
jgi:hypothetical protein